MAGARTDPPRGTEEKPGQEANAPVEGSPKAAGGKLLAWLPLVAAVVLMPVLAYVVSTFVLVPKLQKALHAAAPGTAEPATTAAAAPAPAAAPAHGEESAAGGEKKGVGGSAQHPNVPLNKLLVNVAGTMGARYLLTSLVLVGSGPDFPTKVAEHEAQLKDVASGLLMTKTIADLEKPGARNVIRGELLAGFNGVLGGTAVQEIYFTEFAIQ